MLALASLLGKLYHQETRLVGQDLRGMFACPPHILLLLIDDILTSPFHEVRALECGLPQPPQLRSPEVVICQSFSRGLQAAVLSTTYPEAGGGNLLERNSWNRTWSDGLSPPPQLEP